MHVQVLSKVAGNTETIDANSVNLQSPSIVRLKIAPEAVRSLERHGADLKLVLLSGETVFIQNFFVQDDDGNRSDLVLEDDAGVLWWGQYSTPWSEFHFTEIETDTAVSPWWLLAGLGLLGGAAVGASGGGGGGGDSDGNRPPVAGNDTGRGHEDSLIIGNVLRNDSAPDGDPLRVTGFNVDVNGNGKPDSFNAGDTVKIAGVGTLTLRPDGSYTFTPDPDWNGKVPTVNYTISDGQGGSDNANLDITVDPVQDPPVAVDDSVITNENTPVTGNVLTNDSDPDGDPLTVTEFKVDTDGDGTPETFMAGDTATILGVGILTVGTNGSYTFTPEPGWNGAVPIVTYTTSDGQGTDTAVLTITVNGAPVPVGLMPDQSSEDANTGISVNVTGAFADVDDPTLTYSASGLPTGLTIDPMTGLITGTVDRSASQGGTGGVYSVTITATDSGGLTTTQTFDWTVTNLVPTAVDDTGSGGEGTPVTGNVLTNDSDPDGDPLTVTEFKVDTDGDGTPETFTAGGTAMIPGVGTLTVGTNGSYTFTPEPGWSGKVPIVTYTTSDGEGGTDTADLTITVNDAPVPVDDLSLMTTKDTSVDMDVLANDTDLNDGETAGLRVVQVNGQPITSGGSVTILDGSGGVLGTVSLNGAGPLTFTPSPGVSGQITIPYTVDDGSGATNATATADWVINVVGVDIVDNASPADASLGDDVLASIDNLQSVAISGQVPVDGSLTSLTVSDGTTTVVIDAGTVTVNPDGSFNTTEDLSGLKDGPLTVTMQVKDAGGNSATITDEILKDTVTPVTIDPLLVVDGVVPTVTGTGEPGATVTLTIDGVTPIDVTVGNDGTWTYTPSSLLNGTEVTIRAEAQDRYGNTNDTERKVAGLSVQDQAPGDDADVLVYESALGDGSDPATSTESATSTFTLSTTEGDIERLVIGGSVASGAVIGGTTVTLSDLQNAGTTPIAINTTYGILTITGYDSSTGKVSFSYDISQNTTAHTGGDPASLDTVRENIQITVVDSNGDTRVGTVVAGVVDDAPTASDETGISLDEGGVTVGYDVGTSAWSTGSQNLLDNDTQGADGARIHEITYTDNTGASVTVAIDDGGSKTVATQYGELTVYSNGNWTYTSVSSADHDKAMNNDTTLSDDFNYTLIDGDGDISNAATQPITVNDTMPSMGTPDSGTVDEASLALGSTPDASKLSVTGSLKVTSGTDAMDTVFTDGAVGSATTVGQLLDKGWTSGGTALEYAVSNDGHTLLAYKGTGRGEVDKIFTADITNPTNGGAGYSFTLNGPVDHGGDPSLELDFSVTVTDSDDDSAGGKFTITITDDAPQDDVSHTVDEDQKLTFNTTADADPSNTTISQGGSPITGSTNGDGGTDYVTEHGKVTVNADGTITYTPDEHYSGTETFVYKTMDGGSGKDTTVSMTVNPVSDEPGVSVDSPSISTPEDMAVALGLNAPTITDAVDKNGLSVGDNPERLGLITLTGIPVGAELLHAGGALVADGSAITIFLSDIPSVVGMTLPPGTLTMTSAEFEALQVKPPKDAHENFTVHMSVSSYEVDASGNIAQVGGMDVPGAESSIEVKVDVLAVTDTPELTLEQPAVAGDVGAVSLTTTAALDSDNAKIDAAMDEDGTLNLQSVLKEAFIDTDGSETLWYEITGLPEGTQVTVGGTTYTAGADGEINTSGNPIGIQSAGQDPNFTVKPPANYSNSSPINAKITLHVQDSDGDSPGHTPKVESVEVDLTLRIYAKPDNVRLSDSSTVEDTAVAFLQGIASGLIDSDGSESISQVRLTGLPSEGGAWTLLDHDGNPITILAGGDATGGGLVLTIGTGPGEYTLEQIQTFTLKPPAHSSFDGSLTVYVTTTEGASNTQSGNPESKEWVHDLKIVVTPQAEVIGSKPGVGDTDGDGDDDLAMNPDHDYVTAGEEDAWFSLGKDGSFDLGADWENQDTNEQTFARLTPELVGGDGTQVDAVGSQFRWSTDGGITWEVRTYVGQPIDVPMAYLSTLEFMAAPNFSGMFKIKVQAHTVDNDEDGDGTKSEKTSGEAWLTNVLIKPKADGVTLALSHASGNEDSEIPLSIRPTSSDPSETFNITISNIPVGAIITYGTGADVKTFTATAGNTSWEIEGFDSSKTLSIKPPLNSNEDFTLNVSSESVDTLTVGEVTHQGIQAGPSLSIDVTLKGVADAAEITLSSTTPSYTEAGLDDSTQSVLLTDLVTVALVDTDSEALTIRISGLPDGFSPSLGTLLTAPTVTGENRVWVLTQDQFNSATINVPANYSGTVDFTVGAVTTENDGNSLTGPTHTVQFTVTPSPEASVTNSATLTEDVLSNIGLGIVHQNGDVDETLAGVRIAVSEATAPGFILYLGDDPGTAQTLAQALADGNITSVTEGGVQYYVLDATQAGQLAAQGGSNLDGDLAGFDFQYQITDGHYGSVPSGSSTTSGWQNGHFDLVANPVTDAPDVSITNMIGTKGTTTSADGVTGDDASPDTVTLTAADTVTVTLNVHSPDQDGSEHLVRIVIDGVPDGVTVTGGEFIGGGQWLLVYDGTQAKPIGAGDLQLQVEFVVGDQAGAIDGQGITLTVQVQDRGNLPDQISTVEFDSVTWYLDTTFFSGTGDIPATIDQWEYNNAHVSEDMPFSLSDIINAKINVVSTAANIFTITLENLPPGTNVTGMTLTTVVENGVSREVWSVSKVSELGMLDIQIEQMLQELMDGITITPPLNTNENNATGAFDFDAKLTTSVAGGSRNETADIDFGDLGLPVDPVTDSATIDIQLNPGVETDELNESDSSIPITLTVSNTADGAAGSIVDGTLYLQLSADTPRLQGGTLTIDGTSYTLQSVTGVSGVPDDDYYVVQDVAMGDTLNLVYTPPGAMTAGNVTVNAWVQNEESGSAQDTSNAPLTSTGTGTVEVHISNDGVTIDSDASSGNEVATGATSVNTIELTGLSATLNDNDSSEHIVSILLSNLPDGFLVYTGADAASATLASNAGGAIGFNTWVVSGADGTLPGYVGIMPPPNWSGTLGDLQLIVESSEKTLSETRIDTHPLADVTVNPVANGVTLDATKSLGQENAIVELNLNAAMRDGKDATVKGTSDSPIAPDGSIETTSLKITGLGEHASFYVGDPRILLDASQFSYDDSTGTYTLTGLSQDDLDTLAFMQAKSALTDQDSSTAGTQINIEAWTVESGDPTKQSAHVDSMITLDIRDQLVTTGNDTLIWTGSAINARNGIDTVQMRYGESLAGQVLAAQLKGVEIIDMGIDGANSITELTPEQLMAIATGSDLEIRGTAEDTLSLSGNWVDNGNNTYTGTVTGSDGGSDTVVTLTITGDVDVAPVAAGFSLPFGLAHLNVGDTDPDDAFLFGLDNEPLDLSMMLQSPPDTGSAIEPWLPQGDAEIDQLPAEITSAASQVDAYVAYAPEPMTLDDELQHDLQGAMAVG
ncbi:MAG: cadherin-like domain-containing protein [Burkholderiaceae bacterium]|nr:cadherin-like domain-containing protein [Burkholderiaceae bacterium]